MFGLRKKALVKAVCGTVTLMGMLPWGIASAETPAGKEVTVNVDKSITPDGSTVLVNVNTFDFCTVKDSNSNNIFNLNNALDYSYYGYAAGIGTEVKNNVINVYGGSFTNIAGGLGNGTSTVSGNIVNMSGGTVANVYGGYGSGKSTISGNIVNMSGGAVTNVYGGYSTNSESTISGNIVKFSNVDMEIDPTGYGIICAGSSSSGGTVTSNEIKFDNATVSTKYIDLGNAGISGSSTKNKLYLSGENNITCTQISASGGIKSENNIIVNGINNVLSPVGEGNKIFLYDIQELKFLVPENAVNGNTMLTLNSPFDNFFYNITAVKYGVNSNANLQKGDTINLIESNKSLTDVGLDLENCSKVGAEDAGYMEWDAEVSLQNGEADNSKLVLKITGDKPSSGNTKSFAETRAGGMGFLNNAADMATSKGLFSAQAAAVQAQAEADAEGTNNAPAGYTPFAAVGVANMRYETGSYVDSKGWGINVGFSRILNYENSKLTIAPLIEYGKADYDSYLDNGFHGNGFNQYTGIGCVVKNEMNNGGYYEGSLRFGQMKGDYNGLDEYDTKSNYLALHAGVGKVVEVGKNQSVDYYGKFFWTRQNGDTVTLKNSGAQYDFDAINSYRTRLGARWSNKLNKTDSFYAGLAWDYEFDSEARAHYNGMATPAPTMKGSSGMLEIGWKQELSKENPIAIDLSLGGWVGKQRGITFNAGFSWEF